MAQRRMFSKDIIDSDAFLEMPSSTQCLYFHLSMRADDDGFLNNPKKIQRMIGCSEDDFKILLMKKFIIIFESGICVIKHWRIHNYIKKDRYKETLYQEEKSFIGVKENGAYTRLEYPILLASEECIQNGDKVDTQDRLGKVRLGKDSIELGKVISDDEEIIISAKKTDKIIKAWNELNLQKLSSINYGTNRYKLLNLRIKEYGIDKIIEAIERIGKSSFLKGENDRGWTITFDWFIKPNNFPKLLEGNYDDKVGANNGVRGIGKDSKTSENKYSKYNFDR